MAIGTERSREPLGDPSARVFVCEVLLIVGQSVSQSSSSFAFALFWSGLLVLLLKDELRFGLLVSFNRTSLLIHHADCFFFSSQANNYIAM